MHINYNFTVPYIQQSSPLGGDALENIARQLHLTNENLLALTKAVNAQSFWDSQLFAAILGASSAIITQHALNWFHKRKERLDKIYSYIAQKYYHWSPETLLRDAFSTFYPGGDKPLGEKMIIKLRGQVKYWTYPSFRLRRHFKKYEQALLEFNKYNGKVLDSDELKRYLLRADTIHEKLKDRAFKQTGENEWTT